MEGVKWPFRVFTSICEVYFSDALLGKVRGHTTASGDLHVESVLVYDDMALSGIIEGVAIQRGVKCDKDQMRCPDDLLSKLV